MTNADIYAPGVNIRSTLLDDTYASWSGTSMATPIVAGIAGLLVSEKTGGFWGPDLYQGQIINSGEGPDRINAVTALTQEPLPHLILESYIIDDSTGDNDGIPDANETIDLYFTIRNTYGNATGVTATLSTIDIMATVTDPNANYDNIGPSASDDNTDDPITVQISPDAGNSRDIVFEFRASAENGGVGIDEEVVLTVQRGLEVSGIINTDTTWSGDNLYLITGNVLVQSGAKLTIMPGTVISFGEDTVLQVDGVLQAIATKDAHIVFQGELAKCSGIRFTGSAVDWDPATKTGCAMVYCDFLLNVSFSGHILWINDCSPLIRRCQFRDYRNPGYVYAKGGPLLEENIFNNVLFDNNSDIRLVWSLKFKNNTVVGNTKVTGDEWGGVIVVVNNGPAPEFLGNNVFSNSPKNFELDFYVPMDITGNYWGTTDANEISEGIWDFWDDFQYGEAIFIPFLSLPSPNAPAVLHTAAIAPLSPVGPGNLTFTLTFSRPMDTNTPPVVSFGASEPYTQHIVTDGNWIDPNTWQGTYPITLFTGDGLQTIRVAGAKDVDIGFEIPRDTRFGFEIDTAGLSGVNLQASGEAGRVDLYYNPVDEPDLAGYNIYRSDVNGGPYTKINPAVVLDANYSDYTAPAGITKYYVVTAVRTDFDESDYSDEAYAAALDVTSPNISHTPIIDRDIVGPPGITIQATITDPGTGVAGATLYYKKTSETTYSSLAMNNPSGDLWSENIPGAAVTLEGIDYYITAEDNSVYSDTAYHGTAASPHHIIVYTEKCGPLGVPAGPSSQSYCTTDVTIEIHSNDTAGEVTVYRMEANAPNVNEPSLKRHWAIRGLEGSTFSADIIFSYSDGDLTSAGLDEGNLILRKSADAGHTYQAVHATTDPMGNTVETTYEQMSFSMWTVSEFVCGDFGFLAADLDKSCRVDFGDFAVLGNQWRQPPGIPSADIAPEGGDNVVDWLDLDVLAQHWLEDTAL